MSQERILDGFRILDGKPCRNRVADAVDRPFGFPLGIRISNCGPGAKSLVSVQEVLDAFAEDIGGVD